MFMLTLPDHRFSLYELIDWRNIYNIFSERRALLASWCRTIELAVIERQLQTEVYAGFQQMRYLKPVQHRYQQMSVHASQVWVFGQAGSGDPALDKISGVYLRPGDQLIKEWFLVVDHPSYSRALVAHEMTKPGTPHAKRMFRGILTSDQGQVKRFAHLLRDRVSDLRES
jgi:DICT domain-containing protein